MCAEFMIVAKVRALARQLGIPISEIAERVEWPERFFPRSTAPVIAAINGKLVIVPMQFSMIPSWSKEERPKFATHNARIETISEKATWKRPFLSQRVVIPMTHFIEPSYEGEFSGNMVKFSNADSSPLLAAGVFDRWNGNQERGEVLSFAILTSTPSPIVASIGHDRQPIFLRQDAIEGWIDSKISDKKILMERLNEGTATPAFVPAIHRAMKKSST